MQAQGEQPYDFNGDVTLQQAMWHRGDHDDS